MFFHYQEGSLVDHRVYMPYTLVGPPALWLVLAPLAVIFLDNCLYIFFFFNFSFLSFELIIILSSDLFFHIEKLQTNIFLLSLVVGCQIRIVRYLAGRIIWKFIRERKKQSKRLQPMSTTSVTNRGSHRSPVWWLPLFGMCTTAAIFSYFL